MPLPRLGLPDWGVGVGLRVPHYREISSLRPDLDFFEIISENYMAVGGSPRHHLQQVLEHYPLVQHGVSLNIAGPEPPDANYLRLLAQLHREVRGPWFSDHLCWTGVPGTPLHDLLPLPATMELVRLVSERSRRVQDEMGVRFALENTSSYLAFKTSTMPEWEFITRIAETADIGLLLDVNNVYVSAYNHAFDPYEYVNALPLDRVVQIHVAGHSNYGTHLIDTHNGQVIDQVWSLYRYVIERAGPISTVIEWDDELADFAALQALARHAGRVRKEALAVREQRVARGLCASPPTRSGAVPERQSPAHRHSTRKAYAVGGKGESPAEHAEPAPPAAETLP